MGAVFTAILVAATPIPIQREAYTLYPLPLGILAVLLTVLIFSEGAMVEWSSSSTFFIFPFTCPDSEQLPTFIHLLRHFPVFLSSLIYYQKCLLSPFYRSYYCGNCYFFSCPLMLLQRCNDDIILFLLMSLITHSYHNNH